MLPLLPFAAGIATGALAIKLWRNQTTRAGIDKAQDKLRQATVSGLEAIEHSSAKVRAKLAAPAAKGVAAKKPAAAKKAAKSVRAAKPAKAAKTKPAAAAAS